MIKNHKTPFNPNAGRSLLVSELSDAQIEALAAFYEGWTGRDARKILDKGDGPDPDMLSPGLPEGWDAVLGFLARHLPHVLELMDQFAEATQRDGWWLSHRCRDEGIKPLKVQAPRWLIQQGIFEVNAYPVHLLIKRFPIDG